MNSLLKIQSVMKELGSEASITDIVSEISRKYHIANDSHLFYAVKSTMDANRDSLNKPSVIYVEESDLSKIITYEKFEMAYSKFLEQADKNVRSKKSEGSKIPFGFTFESNKNFISGGAFSQNFGQGGASKTPYLSWHVVSIYYVIESSKIVLGIEEERYSKLKDMHPIKTVAIGRKDRFVAVFYECQKSGINYQDLYENFIEVSKQVLKLGL